jgi:hypothetical protein
MAKVHSTTVPTQLAPLWARLTSPGKVIALPDGTLRLKRNAKNPDKQRRPDLDLVAFTRTAEIVAKQEGMTLGTGAATAFIFTLVREIIRGQFNPDYFEKCVVQTAETLASFCTSTEDQNPPPYGYRTALFMPTIPVYPNGVATTDPAGFSGEKVGLFFEDTFLKWRRIRYTCKNIDEPDLLDRVILRWDCTITAGTSSRGSRPMFSLNIFGVWAKNGAAALTVFPPPILKRTLLYWRFKIPISAAPFYNASQVRRIVKPFSRIAKAQGAGAGVALILNAANRPMMGRGFNNNNIVQTAFVGDPELWEVKDPCIPWTLGTGNVWTWQDPTGTVWTATITATVVTIHPDHSATIYLDVNVFDGVNRNSINITQALTGNWNFYWDTSNPGGDGALPTYTSANVVDVSCKGGKVILSVARRYLDDKHGTRGYLLLSFDSPTSATLTTIADTPQCNPLVYTFTEHDYPPFGLKVDGNFIPAHIFWMWFDKQDNPTPLYWSERTSYPYPGTHQETHYEITYKGSVLSSWSIIIDSNQITSSTLDGLNVFNQGDSLSPFLKLMDRTKSSIQVNPNWNTRLGDLGRIGTKIISNKKVAMEMFYPVAHTGNIIGPTGVISGSV